MLFARIEADANPQIAQAFQAQSVPTVVAVLAGQPLPLFQGAYPRDQVRAVLDQVLAAAEANGIAVLVTATGPDAQTPEVEPEPELPPLHQAAYDAIERDDLDAARAAYEQAIKEDPRDALARAGLAQVGLLDRTRDADLQAARAAAAADPKDLDAQAGGRGPRHPRRKGRGRLRWTSSTRSGPRSARTANASACDSWTCSR